MSTPGLLCTAARMNTAAPDRSWGVSVAGQVMVAEVALSVPRDTAGVVVACPRMRIAWTCAAFVNVGIPHTPSYTRYCRRNDGEAPLLVTFDHPVGSVGAVAVEEN